MWIRLAITNSQVVNINFRVGRLHQVEFGMYVAGVFGGFGRYGSCHNHGHVGLLYGFILASIHCMAKVGAFLCRVPNGALCQCNHSLTHSLTNALGSMVQSSQINKQTNKQTFKVSLIGQHRCH